MRGNYFGAKDAATARVFSEPEPSGKVQPRLLTVEQAAESLNLRTEEVRQLIDTRQLTVLLVLGNERIDTRDLDGLINTYKRTAMRRGDSFLPEEPANATQTKHDIEGKSDA